MGGGEERVRVRGVGGVGEGGGKVGGGVGSVVGDESQEMEDGGSAEHSFISLMNSQSVSELKLKVTKSSLGVSVRVNTFLVSVLSAEEKVQL